MNNFNFNNNNNYPGSQVGSIADMQRAQGITTNNYAIPTQYNFAQANMMANIPQHVELPPFTAPKNENEEFYKRALIGILKHGLTKAEENNLSSTRGYICTMRGSQRPDGTRFGLTFNLGHNTQFRYLSPYVYNMSEANIQNGGYGDIIDERFMASATWLSPQLSALRDNWGQSKFYNNGNWALITAYMDAIDNYLDLVSAYISPLIQLDNFGNVIQTPNLQKALRNKYTFGGINITPSVVKLVNANNTISVVVSFLYSLAEEVTLELKRDITYMDNDR